MPDTFFARLRRRTVTVPSIYVGLSVVTVAFPLLLLVGMATDLAMPRRRVTKSTTRFVFFMLMFFWVEAIALLLLLGVFITTIGRGKRRTELTWPAQRYYTAMHLWAVKTTFNVRFEVQCDELAARGPYVVLMRHASIIDALIPGALISGRHFVRLRYVLKKELLAEPCLDVAGHWLPNHFVRRGSSDSAAEISAVGALKRGLGEGEGVMIYPEGTRFSKRKRASLLVKYADQPELKRTAESLRHLLPIRRGHRGAPFCVARVRRAHRGSRGARRVCLVADIVGGSLVGRTVVVRYFREPAASIPPEREAQISWLNHQWERLDEWVDEMGQPS